MPRSHLLGAVRRDCPICLKIFRPMTDRQWELIWPRHLESDRHAKWLRAKASTVSNRLLSAKT